MTERKKLITGDRSNAINPVPYEPKLAAANVIDNFYRTTPENSRAEILPI
jgi:hypothetical protein